MKLPSETVREAAGKTWPVVEALAGKTSPYILKAWDTPGGTDYNADFVWHALDKEKRWGLGWGDRLGVVNPNADLAVALDVAVEGLTVRDWRPVVHTVDTLIYQARAAGTVVEAVLRCRSSSTLACSVIWQADEPVSVEVRHALLKTNLSNPPLQRFVLPNQKFGAGVETTCGGLAWTGSDAEGFSACACFYEWIRGRCRGRRLLVSVVSDGASKVASDVHAGEALNLCREVLDREGAIHFTATLRRFTLKDTWNPELAPGLYRRETEEQAIRASLCQCQAALRDDLDEALRVSVQRYQRYPEISLPVRSWEADSYACLEMILASTFSPLGALKTPFYNFCRVHAHDPLNWWSYGMHAHESLATLFLNCVQPELSADFLRGHISRQTGDGRYPYGVSHAQGPRTKTSEATLPLIVWEAWRSYLWSGDRDFLAEAFSSGVQSHDWWVRTRSSGDRGLSHWLNASAESARDDDDLPTWRATDGSQNQDALDLNCYLLVQERTLSSMARELGYRGDEARYQQMAESRAQAMNILMWHDGDKCYYGARHPDGAPVRVKDISTFFPLWAGLAGSGRFEGIVRLLEDADTFGTPCGPPSLARCEVGFGADRHWKGANWVEMTALVAQGLRNYGYFGLASDLAFRNAQMVFDELERFGHFREYFNSETGEGVDLVDYVWTGMPAWFVTGVFFGIEPRMEGLEIMPSLPKDWSEIELQRLAVRGKHVSLYIRRDPGNTDTNVLINGSTAEPWEGRGVLIPWDELADDTEIEISQPWILPEAPSPPDGAFIP